MTANRNFARFAHSYLHEFPIFSPEKICYFINFKFFFIKNWSSLIDFDVLFPMQSSEFTKITELWNYFEKKPNFSLNN